MSTLHVAVIDVLHLATKRSGHRKWSIMFLKISQNSQENTGAGWVDLINAEAATGDVL